MRGVQSHHVVPLYVRIFPYKAPLSDYTFAVFLNVVTLSVKTA